MHVGRRIDCEWAGRVQDLPVRDSRCPLGAPLIPEGVGVVSSPLVASEWERVLAGHPDQEFGDVVVRAASENPEPIDRYVYGPNYKQVGSSGSEGVTQYESVAGASYQNLTSPRNGG
jgi:hypothetical protein